jgi:hypothetical protein
MKHMKNARFVEWSLMFLTINLLFSFNPLPSSGQGNTELPNMVNTVWWSPMQYFERPTGGITEQSYFLFEQDGKVTQHSTAMRLSQIQAVPSGHSLMYNPIPWVYQEGANPLAYNSPYRLSLTVTPGLTASAEEVGKYGLIGKTLQIDFPSSRVIATFDGEKFLGETTDNKTGEKRGWSIQRVPNDLLKPSSPTTDEKRRPKTTSDSASYPIPGRWSGDYIAKTTLGGRFSDDKSEHIGVWDISIDSNGAVAGTDLDRTSGHRSSLNGFIDEAGFINLLLKDGDITNTIKGTIEKEGNRLTGTLNQYYSGRLCATINVYLQLSGAIESGASSSVVRPMSTPDVKPPTIRVGDGEFEQAAILLKALGSSRIDLGRFGEEYTSVSIIRRCQIKFEERALWNSKARFKPAILETAIPLSDVNIAGIAITQVSPPDRPSVWIVTARTIQGRVAINSATVYENRSLDKIKVPTQTTYPTAFPIGAFMDYESADRYAKAFANAARLCGAKSETY